MLKTEAENFVRSTMEETGAQFTDEQIEAMVITIMKICGRMIEEALSSWRPNVPGSRPTFFTD